MIVEVLRQLEEGFIDDINDMLVFFKFNLITLLSESCGP